MMDTLAALMLMENLEEDIAAGAPLRTGNNSRSGPTGQYQARDGAVIITAASDDQWRRLCDAIGAPELVADVRFARYQVRSENAAAARAAVQERIGGMTREAALACLAAGDVPCAPVRTVAEILADPHFRERGRCGRCGTPRWRGKLWRAAAMGMAMAMLRRWWSGSPFCLTGGRCRMWRVRRRWGSTTRACWGSCVGWMRGSWSGCGRTGWSEKIVADGYLLVGNNLPYNAAARIISAAANPIMAVARLINAIIVALLPDRAFIIPPLGSAYGAMFWVMRRQLARF